MYIPDAFAESDPARLHALMRRHDFATLVTVADGAPFATHLPVLLDAGRGERGTLVAHMARANPQWRGFDGAAQALAIFHGPHAYVSPTWYEAQPSVPTWNYAVVHAYGAPRILDDETAVRGVLRRTTLLYERGDWSFDALPEPYLRGMVRGVVAFEIPIDRLEGKLKLSQNRPPADRRNVVAALDRADDPLARALAGLMADMAS